MINFMDDDPRVEQYLRESTPRDIAGQSAMVIEMINRVYGPRGHRPWRVAVLADLLELVLFVTYRHHKRGQC